MSSTINNKYKSDLINIIFCLYPIAFILGNLFININTMLLILISIFFFKKKIFSIPFSNFDKLFVAIFIYTFFVMVFNLTKLEYFSEIKVTHFENPKTFLFTKSIFFFRYLLLFFIIKFLISNKIINFKNFFLISTLACLFVCFDIFYQFIFNKDIFGLVPTNPRKLSGPFGAELIAGSFIQKFFPFSIYLIYMIFKNKKKYILIFFLILIFLSSIILSGNRMPLILTIFSIFIFFYYEKKIRKYFFITLTIFILLFSLIYNNNTHIKNNYASFGIYVAQILSYPFSSNVKRSQMPAYFHEFESFYDTWRLNTYFGGGIKSFRIYCIYRKNIDIDERRTCNTHPHNYYLEIITELGIIGLISLIILFYKTLKNSLKSFFKNEKNSKQKYFFLLFFILFFIEIFPLKNTGSFFSTWNATFIFILISCIQGINSSKKIYFK